MISITGSGWGKLETEDFTGAISYTTEVPLDFLNAALHYLQSNKPQAVFCDEEGSCFTFILTDYPSFVITEREAPALHVINKSAREIIKELLDDIERDTPEAWASEFAGSDAEVAKMKQLIKKKVEQIKKLLKR